jgi:hypothetical protein
LSPKLKENLDAAGQWVDTCEVWAFVKVAVGARESQVIFFVAPAGLDRDDVFNLVGDERFVGLSSRQYSHLCSARSRTNRRIAAPIMTLGVC